MIRRFECRPPTRDLLRAAFGILAICATLDVQAAVDVHVFDDTLVLDQGQANPHDVTTFTVPRFDPTLGALEGVAFVLRSEFGGGCLFHGVHGEGYFHYRPRNYVESEIFDVDNPPDLIVDNVQELLTCHAYSGGGYDVACEMSTVGDMTVVASADPADVPGYAGAESFTVQIAQQDRSLYSGNFPPDPGGPPYTGLTFIEYMYSNITLEVRYTYVPTSGVPDLLASSARLGAPTPNPSRWNTSIGFELQSTAPVRLTIHDASGRSVRRLFEGMQEVGLHSFAWDGLDEAGSPTPAGIYFARLGGPGISEARTLVRMR